MFGLREFLSRANTDSEKDVSSSPLAPVAASSFPDFGASSEDNRDDTHNDNEKILRNLFFFFFLESVLFIVDSFIYTSTTG